MPFGKNFTKMHPGLNIPLKLLHVIHVNFIFDTSTCTSK